MKYYHPKSLTWWSGMASIALGLTKLYCTACNLGDTAGVFAVVIGATDASPASLIIFGLVAIGLRSSPGMAR